MKKVFVKLASKVASLSMELIGRLLIYAGYYPRGRKWLGRIFILAQQSAYENRVGGIRRKYSIHPSVSVGTDTYIFGDGEISIGEGTYIGQHSFIVAHPADAKIDIGRGCAISHGVHIRTAAYRTNIHFRDALKAELDSADIVIGDYVTVSSTAIRFQKESEKDKKIRKMRDKAIEVHNAKT